MKQITNVAEYQKLLDDSRLFVVYKHSSSCSLSASISNEVKAYLVENSQMEKLFYQVLVIENRELSNYIAENTGVRHESPQILVFKEGVCVWNDSHTRLSKENLNKNISNYLS